MNVDTQQVGYTWICVLFSTLLCSPRFLGTSKGKQHPLVFSCVPGKAELRDASEFKNESTLEELDMQQIPFLFRVVSSAGRDFGKLFFCACFSLYSV